MSLEISNKIGDLVKELNKLGRLKSDFDPSPLLELLEHPNAKVRGLAVKNLSKIPDKKLVKHYKKVLAEDESSFVRREAASALGRLRYEKNIPILIELLKDKDPNVILQAIRGLLVFKGDEQVDKKLKALRKHPNEIVSDLLKVEYGNNGGRKSDAPHSDSDPNLRNKIVLCDTRDLLKKVPKDSIHLTFTSPPYYNARDYSIYKSYEQYLSFLEEVFQQVFEATKEGRFFILNTSPVIVPRVGRKYASRRYPIPYDVHPLLIKMGWEFIDDIVWVKPEASAKNRNAGFLQHRKPLAYKPNSCTESLMVYRKKTSKLIDWNIKQYPDEIINASKVTDGYESSNIWKIDPVFDKTHSAVFPKELCNRVIDFYSYKGDLVFDPFAGSGTFGKAALEKDRRFLLAEQDEKYFERMKENLGQIHSTIEGEDPEFITLKELRI